MASEAASLAGHLKLGGLVAVYDDNRITIDGDTACAFTEDVVGRFEAYGWHTVVVGDGDGDFEGLERALRAAKEERGRPSLVVVRTTIGFGSKVQGTGKVHGSPLEKGDVECVKRAWGFDPERSFVVSQEVYGVCRGVAGRGAGRRREWEGMVGRYRGEYAGAWGELERRLEGRLPEGWEGRLPTYGAGDGAMATRKCSEGVLTALWPVLTEMVGGSADLTGSNLTRPKEAVDFQPPSTGLGSWEGRYIRYGVREHGMAGIMNGLAAYGTIIPFGGTFLNFVSYAAGAVRLSALSHRRVVYVATHDSIGLGEDGPTHQPIETLAHFRALPNCMVWRPADGNETSAAYYVALVSKSTPSIIALSRQNLPQLENSTIGRAVKGGYTAVEAEGADITLVSTGSEVGICVDASVYLKEKHGVVARVVSLPCWEVFDAQEKEYRLSVLPGGAPILSVEVMSTLGWERYSHEQFGLNRFGASGPYKEVSFFFVWLWVGRG